MANNQKERTLGLGSKIRWMMAKPFAATANTLKTDSLLVLRDNEIKEVPARFGREPAPAWYIKNKDNEPEMYVSNNRLRYKGNYTELMYEDIEQIVDPAAIKLTEVIKENQDLSNNILDIAEDDEKGIPVPKERSYIDPKYLSNVLPYGLDPKILRYIEGDTEEQVKNYKPDENSTLVEVGKAVTYVFLGFIITFAAMSQGGGGGGLGIGDAVTNVGMMLPYFI
jgi:hypothetical protein